MYLLTRPAEAGDAAAELDAFFTALPPHVVARFESAKGRMRERLMRQLAPADAQLLREMMYEASNEAAMRFLIETLDTETPNPKPSSLNPQPSTLNPQPSTLNPQP